jgi:hypothetical protein
MVSSSVCYLSCSWFWFRYEHACIGYLFWAVAAFSCLADGLVDYFPKQMQRWCRILDRMCGAVGLVASIAFNCTSLGNAALAFAAGISAVWWLGQAQKCARQEPHRRTKYLSLQCAWHVYGAIVLCLVTCIVQGGHGF